MIDQMVSYNRNTGPSMQVSVLLLGDSNERSRVQGAMSNPWYLPLCSRPCTMGMALDSTRKTVNRSGGRE